MKGAFSITRGGVQWHLLYGFGAAQQGGLWGATRPPLDAALGARLQHSGQSRARCPETREAAALGAEPAEAAY